MVSKDLHPPHSPLQMWTPLESASGIRILKLLPGSGEQPVECKLDSASLDEDDCHYQALSYCWGPVDRVREIKCNGASFDITRNLHSALLRLRDSKEIVPLWVDALCINQLKTPEALRERAQQVQLMWRIFSKAEKVIVNLGDAVPHQENLKAFLQPFRSLPKGLLDHIGHNLPDMGHPCWPAVTDVLSRPYFGRIWIIQEYTLAEKLEFLIGTARFEDDFLDLLLLARKHGFKSTLGYLSGGKYETDINPALAMSNVMPASFGISASLPAQDIMAIRRFWRAHLVPEWVPYRHLKVFELIMNAAQYGATDERDRVYALLGLLLQGGHRIINIDYSDTVEHLSQRVAIYLLSNGVGPLILYHCVGCQAKGRSWDLQLLQYTNDWLSGLVLPNQSCEYFNAAGSSAFRVDVGKDDSSLLTDVVMLDEITNVSPRNPASLQELDTTIQALRRWVVAVRDWIGSLQTSTVNAFDAMDLWRTVTCNMRGSSERYDHFADLSALVQGVIAVCANNAPTGPTRSAVSEDIASMMQLVEAMESEDADLDAMNEALLEQKGLSDVPEDILPEINPCLSGLFKFAAGRCLAVTENEMMALVPGDAQAKDRLAIILGAPIPFVLREEKDGFKVVGSCYIHYMMDGEALGSHLWQPQKITLY